MTKISQIIARLQSFCMGLILSAALLLCLQNSALANYDYTPIDGDKQAVVVYTYFQIDEDAFPDASLSFETFSRHIDLIKSENLNVISLDDIEDQYKRKSENNTPSIALTFDTGHNSIMSDAVPLLLKCIILGISRHILFSENCFNIPQITLDKSNELVGELI